MSTNELKMSSPLSTRETLDSETWETESTTSTTASSSLSTEAQATSSPPTTDSELDNNDNGSLNDSDEDGELPPHTPDYWGNLDYECRLCGTSRMFCPGCTG